MLRLTTETKENSRIKNGEQASTSHFSLPTRQQTTGSQKPQQTMGRSRRVLQVATAVACALISMICGLFFLKQSGRLTEWGGSTRKSTQAEIDDLFQRYRFLFEERPNSRRLNDIRDGEVLFVSGNVATQLQSFEKDVERTGRNALPEGFLQGVFVQKEADPRMGERVTRHNHHWYYCRWTTGKPVTFHDPKTGKDYTRYIATREPLSQLKGKQAFPPPAPPPGTRPREIAEKYTLPRLVPVSFGPAQKQILVPVPDNSIYRNPPAFYPNDIGFDVSVDCVDLGTLDTQTWIPWQTQPVDKAN